MNEITGSEVDFITSVLKPEKNAPILDLWCGSGRHCIELAVRRFQVTGINYCNTLIGITMKQAEAAKVSEENPAQQFSLFSAY